MTTIQTIDEFCQWVNQITYTACFSLWVKAIPCSILLQTWNHEDHTEEENESFRQFLENHHLSISLGLNLIQHYLTQALPRSIPEEAEFDEFLETEWKPVSESFASRLFCRFIESSPLVIDEEEGDPFSVKKLFPVSDELYRCFERMRATIFEDFHTMSPFSFFSNIHTLDLHTIYDEHVPALIGINPNLLFLAWIN